MNQKRYNTIDYTSIRYWRYQLTGWSLASLYWAYGVHFIHDYSIFYTVVNFILDVTVGISLTHLYKLIINRSGRESLVDIGFFKPVLSIIALSFLFMILNNLKWYLYWHSIREETTNFIESLFYWDPPLITGLRMMTIWVLAYHLYHYYKQQIALTAHNADLAVLAKQIQFDHLSNQLNPHFLFNSLNSVKSLISENPLKAKRSIDLLSDLLRSSIYDNESIVSIGDELHLIYDYIELEKLRFEERLQLEVEVDKSLLSYKIPSLCIQTLVENALKHGIQNSVKGGVIKLVITKNDDCVKIVVQNPGQLLANDIQNNGSLGLKNLKQRLDLHYKEKGTFILIEEPEGLIIGTITVPLI